MYDHGDCGDDLFGFYTRFCTEFTTVYDFLFYCSWPLRVGLEIAATRLGLAELLVFAIWCSGSDKALKELDTSLQCQ
jgi:hypothetical protein